ncbi:MAG: hypothetical protein V4614_00795 [Pseudomonadota bacterium]
MQTHVFFRRCLTLITLLLCSATAFAQTCALPGWQGPVTIAAGTTYVNSYHGGSGSPAAGATAITVASGTGQRSNTRQLLAGDMILIIQMQDSTNGANAGLHEYAQVSSITGGNITLTKPLVNSYAQVMNTTNVRTWQVVWVPQYSALTVTGTASANTWTIVTATGVATGGILAMDVAGSMTLNGTLTASGMGFRGAFGLSGSGTITAALPTSANLTYNTNGIVAQTVGGQKGEGTMGTPPRVFAGALLALNHATLLGQGYALGAGGRASIGNAGGGSNDGTPAVTASSNSYNAGGGGGGNAGAGGQGGNSWNNGNGTDATLNQGTNTNIGNDAGGRGGNAQAASATRLVMGGGGGAGAANNGTVNVLTTYPPVSTPAGTGASGPITSSGAAGGGIVMVRTGSVAGAGRVDVSGVRAYNKWNLTDTDSAGGGGAGGTVFFVAGSGTGTGITINANGGDGGKSAYFQHGPGGGGGGGYIETSLTGATVNVSGGANGTDACCGIGAPGNGVSAGSGSPKAWQAAPGSAGSVNTSAGTPSGLGGGGGSCLPNIAVTKSTSTPNITATTGAQARYSINLYNSGGGAGNVFVVDPSLPRNWSYTSVVATTYAYDPAPPGAGANAGAAGAETTTATAPGAFPVNTVTRANSVTFVTLRANAAAPGVVPTTGANSPTFGSFYLPSEGSLTISFTVNIGNTSTVGTYHNPAGVLFLDPTRTLNTDERIVSPATNVNANRGGIAYSGQTTYQSGATTNVGGSNYSGLEGGPGTEDVTLQPNLSVTKTKSTNTFTLGVTGQSYIMAVRNLGRTVTHQIYANTQATSQSATAIVGSPVLTDTMPAGMSITSVTANDANWTCTVNAGSTTFTCSVTNAADFPWNTNANLATVTATVSVSYPACPGPQINTVNVTTTTLGDSVPSNNEGTVTTPIGCRTTLTVAKINAVTTVNAGSTTSYTVTVANLGPASGDGSVLDDEPGPGLDCTISSCSAAGAGSCPVAGSWPDILDTGGLTLTSFPAGTTLTFGLSCLVTATGK